MLLFEPLQVGPLTLKNRILMPAMQVGVGLLTPQGIAYHRERALGGVGTIITCATRVDCFVSDEAWGEPGGLEDFFTGLPRLVQAVHKAGALLGIQLAHPARYPGMVRGDKDGGEPVAPSDLEGRRGLTRQEIGAIINKFAVAAARAREAGFDLVEVHGTHRSLLREFFSPLTNRRTDEFGLGLEGRMHLGLETVRAIRARVGPDYCIVYRMAAEELTPGGITIQDAIGYAQELEKAGVDLLDVSVAWEKQRRASPPRTAPMATFAPQAAAIKPHVRVPVVAVGRINTPEVAEDILASGKADLVAIGRQLLTDPLWPLKVQEGRSHEIVACDSCNINCFAPIEYRRLPPGAPLCRKNPRLGREWATASPGESL
ncbi:MAG: NADH:flavin oxidoreductase [Chloroflexi bacterium]|nr:NADH:flavin oxidoreductase [Chloroflexota bacterium]